MSTSEPTEEDLRAYEEYIGRLNVHDVLLQTAVNLINAAGRKLEDHDLGQAKAAIEGTRALMPLLPDDAQAQLKPILSQIQMAFVRASQDPGGQPEDEPAQSEQPEQPEQGSDDEAERAKARSKIWTPPGT